MIDAEIVVARSTAKTRRLSLRRRTSIAVVVAVVLAGTMTGCASQRSPSATRQASDTAPENAPDGALNARPATEVPTPVEQEDPLNRLSTLPANTIGMVEKSAVTKNDKYDIVYVPYAAGPVGTDVLVIKVLASKPAASVRKPLELEGKDIAADYSQLEDPGVASRGGRYRAVLGFRPQGDTWVPMLIAVESEP